MYVLTRQAQQHWETWPSQLSHLLGLMERMFYSMAIGKSMDDDKYQIVVKSMAFEVRYPKFIFWLYHSWVLALGTFT